MRLWHQSLLPILPKPQILSQHRECCSLRGKGWNKKHSTVQYALNDEKEKLVAYHIILMNEMLKRKVNIDEKWWNVQYRGKNMEIDSLIDNKKVIDYSKLFPIYDQHNSIYLCICCINLFVKAILKQVEVNKFIVHYAKTSITKFTKEELLTYNNNDLTLFFQQMNITYDDFLNMI